MPRALTIDANLVVSSARALPINAIGLTSTMPKPRRQGRNYCFIRLSVLLLAVEYRPRFLLLGKDCRTIRKAQFNDVNQELEGRLSVQ